MPDNSLQNGTDTIRDLARSAGTVKTQVFQLDLGGATANAEVLITAGQQTMAASVPVVLASNQTAVPVAISSNGLISTANSTAVALGIGGVFTGTWEDVTEQADIRVSVFADQVSATDGLQIQQSSNGVNPDILDSYSIPASTGKNFSIGASAKFYRIVYTNGGVAQTVLRLQVKLHKGYSKSSSVRPQDARTNDNDYEEVLSHLMGYNGTTWDRLRATITNGLAVDVTRLPALVAGAAIVGKVGIDQTTPGTTNLVSIGTTGTVAINAALPTGANTIGAVNIAAAQTLATVTTVGAVTAITNALPAGTNSIGTIQQAAITKGTQGATGITTQDLKDAGRVNIAMTCYQAAGIITTEALFAAATFSISRDGAAATTGQQLAVTAGKRFRLQSIVVGVKNTAAAAGTSKLVLRYLAAGGTITNTSPILAIMDLGSNATVANAYIGPTEMAFPDGVELIASSTFGFTSLCNAVTMLHTISVNGYEY